MNVTPEFSSEEFVEISRDLERFHGVFYRFWTMARPQFTTEVSTAAVYFDKAGDCLQFHINYDFWKTQSVIQKQFIICHECLHVILNHGIRMRDTEDADATNKALDIVVNHSLIERFGFDRKAIDPKNIYCWTDTVFPDEKDVPTNRAFEYYYNRIEKNSKGKGPKSGGQLVDDHSKLEGSGEVIGQLNDQLLPDEKEILKEFIKKNIQEGDHQPGTKSGGGWTFANVGRVVKKRKWETVIKKWALKYIKDNEEEQWARTSRRILTFEGGLMIPSDAEIEGTDKDRIQVWFFQDTSGSCGGFIDRFFAAALSLPPDKFDVKMHCFDTRVFETTLESKKLYGFGGTSFTCIEEYIQNYIKRHSLPYPKAVFVITDGFGNQVNPQNPDKWFWFLTPFNSTSCFPRECNRFKLADYE